MRKIELIFSLFLRSLVIVGCDNDQVTPDTMPATLAPTSTLAITPLPSASQRPIITPETQFGQARETLFTFFDALYRGDYQTEANYYRGYQTLQESFMHIEADEPNEFLREPCTSQENGCQFYSWPVKEIVQEKAGAPGTYVFVVHFEKDGFLLEGGDNHAPVPCDGDDCPHTQFVYTVSLVDGKFYVNETPVFWGCCP